MKRFLFLLLSVTFFFAFPLPIFAQTKQVTQEYTTSVLETLVNSLNCQLTGYDLAKFNKVTHELPTCTSSLLGGTEKGGTLSSMGSLIVSTINTKPASSIEYFAYAQHKFAPIPQTYAANEQSVGFRSLGSLVNLWTIFRNIAYLIFVLVIVLTGIAIMLRLKIDPKMVMTIESAIPRIIIGLLLVTFSYAIAGFLIDVMYASTYLVANVLAQVDTQAKSDAIKEIDTAKQKGIFVDPKDEATVRNRDTVNPGAVYNQLYNNPVQFANDTLNDPNQPGGGIAGMAIKGAGSVKDAVAKIFNADINKVITPPIDGSKPCDVWNVFCGASNLINVDIGKSVGNALVFLLSYGIGVIAILVLIISILVALIRLWITLILNYVYIILDVVFSPFWIVFGLIPGSSLNFSAWLRSIISNLAVYPTLVFMFLFGRIIVGIFSTTPSLTQDQFIAPFIGAPANGAIGALLGIGVILLTPNVIEMVKNALKAPQFKLLGDVQQNLQPGLGFVGGAVGKPTKAFFAPPTKDHAPGAGYKMYSEFLKNNVKSATVRSMLGVREFRPAQEPTGSKEIEPKPTTGGGHA